MCGIAAVVSFNPQLNHEDDLKKLLSNLKHRGPDSQNIENHISYNIGINRLAIVDLKNSNNIFKAANDKIIYVVNGEIFNYKELKHDLVNKGYSLRSNCDSEIIGYLYEEYGMSFINKLNGQFSFILIDQRTNNKKIILARDHFGITPLFYHYNGETLWVASELRSFLEINSIKKEFNKYALDQLFTFWTTINGETFLKNIYQVNPGHYVYIEQNKISETCYYPLDLHCKYTNNNLTFEQAKKSTREILHNAIKIRMLNSDVEVATYLSGGVDSSIITALSQQFATNRKLNSFSIDFNDPLYTEKKFQEIFLDKYKINNHKIMVDYHDIFNSFQEVVTCAGQPLFRTAPIPLYLLSKEVKKAGIKVVLTGEGSDEMFWGYDTFKETMIRKFWSKNPHSKIRPILFKKLFPQYPQFDQKYHDFITSFYERDLISDDSDFYSHLPRWNNSIGLKAIFSEQFKESIRGYDSITELRKTLPKDFSQFSLLSKCQYLELRTLLPNYLLSVQGDRMSSANSVELRIPFLDKNIFEFTRTLPENFKIGHKFKDKYILRESFKDLLPNEIFERSKQAYQAPELTAFSQYSEGTYVEYLFSHEATTKIGIYNPSKVAMVYNKLINAKKSNRVSTRDNLAFIQILSTHIFYSKYIGNIAL